MRFWKTALLIVRISYWAFALASIVKHKKRGASLLGFRFYSLLLHSLRREILGSRMRFLLYPMNWKSPISQGGMKTKIRPFLFCIWLYAYSPRCTLQSVYKQRGVFVSMFIPTMVFGDTSYLMSVTSLYAFLVWYNQINLLLT